MIVIIIFILVTVAERMSGGQGELIRLRDHDHQTQVGQDDESSVNIRAAERTP